jgi:hypothetical protein
METPLAEESIIKQHKQMKETIPSSDRNKAIQGTNQRQKNSQQSSKII